MPSTDTIDVRRLAWTAAALAVLIAVAIAAVLLLMRHWHVPPAGAPAGSAQLQDVPAPRLQSAPQPDLARFRAEQGRAMDAVGWVDREHGIARIPVSDAMDLVAAGKGVR